jgi:hypothetical protein
VTRISKNLLVQRVDDRLVLMDSSAGAEIVYTPEERRRLVEAIQRLFEGSWTGDES